MFERLIGGIQSTFSDLMPHEICVPCFIKGVLIGAGTGLLTIAGLSALATLSAAAATALAVVLAVVGIVALAAMVANWKHMNDEQKSEALGGLVGGALAGGVGAKGIRIPLPKFELLPQPGGLAAIELVISHVVVGARGAVVAAAGGLAGSGLVAMMTGSRTGGSSGEKPKTPLKPPADRHWFNRIKEKSPAKEKTSVAEPWVDMKADTEQINSGQAVRKGDKFIVNGRTYGQHDGTLYPESGPGIHPLDREAFKAFKMYKKFGNTPEAERYLNAMHNVTESQKAAGLAAWNAGKGAK